MNDQTNSNTRASPTILVKHSYHSSSDPALQPSGFQGVRPPKSYRWPYAHSQPISRPFSEQSLPNGYCVTPPLSQTPVQQSWIWDSQHVQEEQCNAQCLAQIEGSPSDDSVTEPESQSNPPFICPKPVTFLSTRDDSHREIMSPSASNPSSCPSTTCAKVGSHLTAPRECANKVIFFFLLPLYYILNSKSPRCAK